MESGRRAAIRRRGCACGYVPSHARSARAARWRMQGSKGWLYSCLAQVWRRYGLGFVISRWFCTHVDRTRRRFLAPRPERIPVEIVLQELFKPRLLCVVKHVLGRSLRLDFA